MKTTREQVRNWVRALREENNFQKLTNARGERFLAWEDFCRTPPPYGFGMSAEEVDVLIDSKPLAQQMANDPVVKKLGERGNHEGKNQFSTDEVRLSDNQTSKVENRGGSAEYLVRRLKRDAPAIAEALGRGEYKSARAAGIAAGIVKPETPYQLMIRAWNRAPPKPRKTLHDREEERRAGRCLSSNLNSATIS